jgi:hypothetical protein
MCTPFRAVLLSMSIAWTPLCSATAQQITERQTAFESLADSQWIRLAVPDVGRHEGRLLERSSELVVLSAEPEPLRVPATTVDTLWTRGNAAKTGAIVGAVILGTLGTALGAWAGAESTDHDFQTGEAMLLGGAVGLFGGAVLGGLTGLAIPKWHRRYP